MPCVPSVLPQRAGTRGPASAAAIATPRTEGCDRLAEFGNARPERGPRRDPEQRRVLHSGGQQGSKSCVILGKPQAVVRGELAREMHLVVVDVLTEVVPAGHDNWLRSD